MPKHRNYSLEEPIGFTRVSEDVLVPSWMVEITKSYELNRNHPFKTNQILIWLLLGMWLLTTLASPAKFRFEASIFTAGLLLIAGIIWYLFDLIPPQWLEINRTDGYITSWSSRRKKKIIAREHITKLAFTASRRYHSSGPKGQTSEHRYHIDIVRKNGEKNALFFELFTLFSDEKILADPDWDVFFHSGAFAHRIEKFIKDFIDGKPLPASSKSTYSIKLQK